MEFNATFLVSIISFVLFTLIMNKIFYRPLGKIITERQNFLDKAYSDAKISNDKADAINKDRDEKLQNSLNNSKQVIAQSTTEANNSASELTQNAKQNSKERIISAKNELQREEKMLDDSLEPHIKTLAYKIASKIMGVEV